VLVVKNWEIKKKEIKTNKEFWYKKIERNIERDIEVNLALKRSGWSVIRLWGKDIIKRTDDCVKKIEILIRKKEKYLNADIYKSIFKLIQYQSIRTK